MATLLAIDVATMLAMMLGLAAVLLLFGLFLDEGIAAAFAGLETLDLDAATLLAMVLAVVHALVALHGKCSF
jgi:hypothetical protein